MTTATANTTTITYDDKTVARFVWASIFWGVIGMTVGAIVAAHRAPARCCPEVQWTCTIGLLRGLSPRPARGAGEPSSAAGEGWADH
jgi:cbb3-type cytochrome oxidase subunit 1